MAFSCNRFSLSRLAPVCGNFPAYNSFRMPPAQYSSPVAHFPSSSTSFSSSEGESSSLWRPMCLYYTQGRCNKMDDPLHIERFSHNCSSNLHVHAADFERKRSQNMDFFLVLDLEGKVEILEFPVLLVDAKSMHVVDFFHRFVRPTKMDEQALNKYIEGKYGKLGVDRVWHDTAVPFKEVIGQFEDWLTGHHLWDTEVGGYLTKAAFVTCGNWDLKTKIPQQCAVSKLKLPPYFMEWINIKDVYLIFYKVQATGMMSMLKQQQIPLMGSHHLGIDDAKNITKVLQRMLADGAVMQITARRKANSQNVEFLFENRIGHRQRQLVMADGPTSFIRFPGMVISFCEEQVKMRSM